MYTWECTIHIYELQKIAGKGLNQNTHDFAHAVSLFRLLHRVQSFFGQPKYPHIIAHAFLKLCPSIFVFSYIHHFCLSVFITKLSGELIWYTFWNTDSLPEIGKSSGAVHLLRQPLNGCRGKGKPKDDDC